MTPSIKPSYMSFLFYFLPQRDPPESAEDFTAIADSDVAGQIPAKAIRDMVDRLPREDRESIVEIFAKKR